MKPSLLYLGGHLPAAGGSQAGMKSSHHLCRVLCRHFDLDLLCFVNEEERRYLTPDANGLYRSQMTVPVDNASRIYGILGAPRLPLSVAVRNAPSFRRTLREVTKSRDYDVAVFDHTAMWQFAGELKSIPVRCGVAHDVLSQLWERRALMATGAKKVLLQMEAARMKKWESDALRQLTISAPFSEKDAQLLRELAPGASVQAIQPWFSNLVDLIKPSSRSGPPKNLLFWGALSRPENQDCVQYTLEKILPLVRKKVPDVHYYIAGAVNDKLREKWSQPGVTVTGFVDDVAALFSQMDIALLPLRLGAGIKIKVLESLSAGLPVVTSLIGIEGIPAEPNLHYLLGNTAEEFAAQVVQLLSSPNESRAMSENAQGFIRSNFSFDDSAERLSELLLSNLR